MIEYFKLLIISVICSIFAALPVSSSGAFAFLNDVLYFTEDSSEASFYTSVIGLAFSIASIIFLRKIIIKSFKVVSGKDNVSKNQKDSYKNMLLCLLISLIPAVIMFIPVGSGRFLMDVFDGYLVSKDLLVPALGAIFGGLLSIVAVVYARKHKNAAHKTSSKRDVARMSVYNIIPNVFPGFSKVFMASTSLTLSGVNDLVVMRDVLLYLAPSTFVISLAKLIRSLIAGTNVDLIMVAICAVVAVLCNVFIIKLATKINVRKSYVFFSIFSILFGALMLITAFVIL